MLLSPLYHWSPADRHNAIRREGLQVGCSPTVASVTQPHVCLGVDPASAWRISGAMPFMADVDEWDLWQVRLCDDDEVYPGPTFGARLQEVNVRNAISPERLWWVGRRQGIGVPTA